MATSRSRGTVCRFFNTPRGCRRGEHCAYVHNRDLPVQQEICKFYCTPNGCMFGDRCYFLHVTPQYNQPPSMTRMSSSIFDGLPNSAGRYVPTSCNNNNVQVAELTKPKSTPDLTCSSSSDIPPTLTSIKESQAIPPKPEHENEQSFNSTCDSMPLLTESESLNSTDSLPELVLISGFEREAVYGQADLLPKADSQNHKGSHEKLMQDAICGECGKEFQPSPNTEHNQWSKLEDHYIDKIGNKDQHHIKFLKKDPLFMEDTFCGVCGSHFKNSECLISHLYSKGIKGTKKTKDQLHKSFYISIVQVFVDHDSGLDDELDYEGLLNHLVHGYTGDLLSETGSSPGGGLGAMAAAYFGNLMTYLGKGAHFDRDDDDDLEQRMNNMGFTDDEVQELACQGIKPWDSEAHAAFDVLYDY